MRLLRTKNIIITLVVVTWACFTQINSAQNSGKLAVREISIASILDSLVTQFQKVEDYTVKVKISVNMPRFRMPKKVVKLYFKQPDKVKIEADGFAVVPKTGVTTSPLGTFNRLMQPSVVDSTLLMGHHHWIIEGAINTDSVEFRFNDLSSLDSVNLITRLWINSEYWVITKMESYLGDMKVMSVNNEFEEIEEGIYLPKISEMNFHFGGDFLATIGNREPLGGPFGERHRILNDSESDDFNGSIRMEFSRYKINRGLKDKIFKKTTF